MLAWHTGPTTLGRLADIMPCRPALEQARPWVAGLAAGNRKAAETPTRDRIAG